MELDERRGGARAGERSALLISSTSFGGIHSSVDRRARWGDPVGEGFARISAGIEDTDDLIADIERAPGLKAAGRNARTCGLRRGR